MKQYLTRKLKQIDDVLLTPENLLSLIPGSANGAAWGVICKDIYIGMGAAVLYFAIARGGISLLKKYFHVKSLRDLAYQNQESYL